MEQLNFQPPTPTAFLLRSPRVFGDRIAVIDGDREQVLVSHPVVLEAAVVAAPDDIWGEIPVAFVPLMDGASVAETALVEHLRSTLAHYKVPKRFLFDSLPKTNTVKIQKHLLRARLQQPNAVESTAR